MNWLIEFISNTLSIGINHFFKSNWEQLRGTKKKKISFVHAVSCHIRINSRYVVLDHSANKKKPNNTPIDRVPVCMCVRECLQLERRWHKIADKIYAIVQSEHVFSIHVWWMRHIIAAHRDDPQPDLEYSHQKIYGHSWDALSLSSSLSLPDRVCAEHVDRHADDWRLIIFSIVGLREKPPRIFAFNDNANEWINTM